MSWHYHLYFEREDGTEFVLSAYALGDADAARLGSLYAAEYAVSFLKYQKSGLVSASGNLKPL